MTRDERKFTERKKYIADDLLNEPLQYTRTSIMELNVTLQANKRDTEIGKKVYQDIQQEFNKGPEVNEQLLMQILQDNKDTEYGKKYGFADIKTVEEYQQKVPVIVYDHVAEAIERMAAGEQNVLTAYPFKHMNETSGTIGAPKKIPMTQKQAEVFARYNKSYVDGLKAELLGESWLKGRGFCIRGKYQWKNIYFRYGDITSYQS